MLTDAFKLNSLSKRISLSFSVLILAILAFQQVATYYIIHDTVQNINSSYITVGLKQKNEKLNSFLNEVDSFSKTVISNRDIQSLLTENKNTNLNLSKFSEISYALSNTVEAVFLVSKEGAVYQEAENELADYMKQNLPQINARVAKSNGEMVFFKSNYLNYGTSRNSDFFILAARKIRSIDTFQDIGIMVVAIRESLLWNNTAMDGELGDFYITAEDGSIVSCKDKDLIGTNVSEKLKGITKNGKIVPGKNPLIANGMVLNNLQNGMTGWSLVNIVRLNELNSNYTNIQRLLIVLGIFAIILAVYISIIISGHITRPIRYLISSMKKVMLGNLDVQTDIALTKGSTDELKELNGVFNQMTRELRVLVKKVYQENLREKEAELRALKAQINPHFLYNTLDTVYWMLIDKSDFDIAELVTKLGEILRYSIKKGSTSVTVRDEIQQVENYLFIQKARFEENLQYEVDVDPGILEYEMLSFLIQPFVENAINHGIMENKGYGKVVIRGCSKEDAICFEIIDDGIGISKEKIGGIYVRKEEKKTGSGIGILNVHDRIRYYYGPDYGVEIDSTEGSGTRIVVKIPVIKPGDR